MTEWIVKILKNVIFATKKTHDMYRQVFIPDEQNYLVSIPRYLYGCEVEVVISPTNEVAALSKKSRNNWANAAKQMHQIGDDILLMPIISNNENLDWWTWEG